MLICLFSEVFFSELSTQHEYQDQRRVGPWRHHSDTTRVDPRRDTTQTFYTYTDPYAAAAAAISLIRMYFFALLYRK